jgi:hypothetical protein
MVLRNEPQAQQARSRPTISVFRWGLADQEQATRRQESGSALRCHSGRPERARDDRLEPLAKPFVSGQRLCPSMQDTGSGCQPRHPLLEEATPSFTCLQQRHVNVWAEMSNNQAGKTRSRSQVEYRCAHRHCGGEELSIGQMRRGGSRPGEPTGPSRLKILLERFPVDRRLGIRSAHDGRTTTRRFGSSPSETDSTPSISAMVS